MRAVPELKREGTVLSARLPRPLGLLPLLTAVSPNRFSRPNASALFEKNYRHELEFAQYPDGSAFALMIKWIYAALDAFSHLVWKQDLQAQSEDCAK